MKSEPMGQPGSDQNSDHFHREFKEEFRGPYSPECEVRQYYWTCAIKDQPENENMTQTVIDENVEPKDGFETDYDYEREVEFEFYEDEPQFDPLAVDPADSEWEIASPHLKSEYKEEEELNILDEEWTSQVLPDHAVIGSEEISPSATTRNIESNSVTAATIEPIPQTGTLLVKQSKTKKNYKKRIWDKTDWCLFCEKEITNFTRHQIRNHSNELEVSKILAKPSGTKERRIYFDRLRKRGNFFHNRACIKENAGKINVVMRPSTEKSPSHYLPCKYCFGFFSRPGLYRHIKLCKARPSDESTRNALSVGYNLILGDSEPSDELKTNVFRIMRHDSISETVKTDRLICEFGNRLLANRCDKHYYVVLSRRMRELGQLLVQLRSTYSETKQFEDCLKPDNYCKIIQSVKELAGYDAINGYFKIPSLAIKLGHAIRQCVNILECRAILTNDTELLDSSKQFLTIMDKRWKYDISPATKILNTEKFNEHVLPPLADDLLTLKTFIEKKENEFSAELKLNPSADTWRHLVEVTLVHVVILNWRRAGESQRMELSRHGNRDKTGDNGDGFNSLPKTGKPLCSSFTRFDIRGGTARRVPILLNLKIKLNIVLLLINRNKCSIHPNNPYMFAIPNSETSTVSGYDVVRKYADLSGAKQLANSTSTKLKKHCAAMSRIPNLSNNEIQRLATLLGHSDNAHEPNCRLPESACQVAKLSKVLLLTEQGKLKDFHGKTLDDIGVDSGTSDVEEDKGEGDDDKDELNIMSIDERDVEEVHDLLETEATQHYNLSNAKKPEAGTGKPKKFNGKRKGIKIRRVYNNRRAWSEDERNAVMDFFNEHILLQRVPNKYESDKCLMSNPVLKDRTWSNIKYFVKNQFYKAK